MAKQVSVLVTCDLHDDKTPAVEAVEFGYGGWTYTLDLCADHLVKFTDSIGGFTAVASKAKDAAKRGRRSTSKAVAAKAATAKPVTTKAVAPGAVAAEASTVEPTDPPADKESLRDWARANGFEVGQRGRISATIRDAYTAALTAVPVAEPVAAAAAEPAVEATAPRSGRRASAAKKADSPAKKSAGRKSAAKAPAKAVRAGKRPAKKAAASVPAATNDIRSWAQANGHQVGDRGRIPAKVREAYEAAFSAVPAAE